MSNESNALDLAQELYKYESIDFDGDFWRAADELRRQQAEIAALQLVVRRAADIMSGGEGVQDQGEAWDRTLRLLDETLAAFCEEERYHNIKE